MERTRSVEPAVEDAGHGRLGQLYTTYAPDAVRLAYLLTGDQQEAADLVQEAFIRLFGRFRDLRDPDAFGAYLRRTIVNLSRDRFRRIRSERERIERARLELGSAVASPPDVAGKETLRQALRGLPHRQRAALVLRYFEDLSERQTADMLRCSIPAVKSLMARGLRTLREQLGGEGWM